MLDWGLAEMNPKVDRYIAVAKQWGDEMAELQEIALDCGLTEEVKWRKPCYTHDGANIAIIQPFKEFCALMFFKGALLQDPTELLIKVGENSRAGRQARFTSVDEIVAVEPVLKELIQEAIKVEEAGLSVDFEKDRDLPLPDELQEKLDDDPELEEAFFDLTPGRQRAYILYFSDAKQTKTRTARVERYREQILDGKGLNDR